MVREQKPTSEIRHLLDLLDVIPLGDVLVTIATGEMTEDEAAKMGLVPTHAYAVIGKREGGRARGYRGHFTKVVCAYKISKQ